MNERGCPRHRARYHWTRLHAPYDTLGLPSTERAAHEIASLGLLGSVLFYASVSAALAGAGVGAYSAYSQGQAQKDLAAYNAKAIMNKAAAEAQAAGFQATMLEQQGAYAAAAGGYQQQLAETQAASVLTQSELMQEETRRRLAHVQAASRLGIAQAGVTSEGSPLLLLMDNAEEAQREIMEIRYGGEVQAAGIRGGGAMAAAAGQARQAAAFGDANLTRFTGGLNLNNAFTQAGLFGMQGSAAMTQGYLGVGSSLLSGIGSAAGQYGQMNYYRRFGGGYGAPPGGYGENR